MQVVLAPRSGRGAEYGPATFPSSTKLLKQFVTIITIMALLHALGTLSAIDVHFVDWKVLGYQLRPDIQLVLSNIDRGKLDTSPFQQTQLLPPFLRYYEIFEISPRYQMSVCMIPKVMSSLLMGTFCYLRCPWKFKAYGREISTEKWHWSFCRERYIQRNYTRTENLLGTVRLAFVRHPIDRFLSGFVNKCILKGPYERTEYCFGCGSNLTCFVSALRLKLWDIYNKGGTEDSAIAAHLSPLSWYCNFKEHLLDYTFLRHEKGKIGVQRLARKLSAVLGAVGVPQHHREYIKKAVLVGKSPHSTSSSKTRQAAERQLFANKALLRSVVELYYYDFVIFGYEIPPVD